MSRTSDLLNKKKNGVDAATQSSEPGSGTAATSGTGRTQRLLESRGIKTAGTDFSAPANTASKQALQTLREAGTVTYGGKTYTTKLKTASNFTVDADYQQVVQELSSGKENLTAGQKELETLLERYNADPSEENANAYNQRMERFQSDLDAYNSMVERYNYYNTAAGIKERVDQLAPLAEAAEKEKIRAQNVLTGLNRYGTQAQKEEWQAKLDAATKEYEQYSTILNELTPLYYRVENQEKQSALQKDAAMSSQYSSAKHLQADMDKVAAVAADYASYGGAQSQEIEEYVQYLKQTYGLTDQALKNYAIGGSQLRPAGEGYTNLWQLYEDLEAQKQSAVDTLAVADYNYEYMTGYEQMLKDAEEYAKKQEEWTAWAKEHPVLSSIDTVLVSPFQGADYLKTMAGGIGHSDVNDLENYVPMNVYNMDTTNYVNTVRGTVSKEIEENTDWELFGQNVASFLYQTGLSVAESATQVAAFGSAATLFMGASAASNQAKNVIERGGTNNQAFWGGLAAGAAEVIFEKISIDQLLSPKSVGSVKDLLREAVKQAGVEASEEMLTEVANILTDAAIMGEKSDFANLVTQYELTGMTEEDAKTQAFWDCVGQVALAGLGGALSGAAMGGAVSGFNYETVGQGAVNRNARRLGNEFQGMGQDVVQAIIQEGLDSEPSTESYKLAAELQQKLESGKTVAAQELGRLHQENVQTVSQEEREQSAAAEAADTESVQDPVLRAHQAILDQANGNVVQSQQQAPTAPESVKEQDAQSGVEVPAEQNKMSLDEFLGQRGLSSPISDYMDDKLRLPRGETARQQAQRENAAAAAAEDYSARRQAAIREYEEKVRSGEIIPKTTVDRLIAVAHGHEDNQATQAARRSLEKRGIDWQTGQMYANNQTETLENMGGISDGNEQPGGQLAGAESAVLAGREGGTAADGEVSLSDRDAGRRGYESERRRNSRVPEEYRNRGGSKENRELTARRQQAAMDQPLISAEDAGVPMGTDAATARILPESAWDDEARAVADWAYGKGIREVVFLVGNVQIGTSEGTTGILAAIDKQSGKLYAKADSLSRSLSENVEHEVGHYLTTQESVEDFMKLVQGKYKKSAWGAVYNAYERKYADVTGEYEGMTPEQKELYVWEEILEDAYSDTNRFGVRASVYGREADAAIEGTESGESTSAAQEDDTVYDADAQQPMTRGPPERFSYGGRWANQADLETLDRAERMEMQNVDAETIRQDTGWFRGADGKWRWEIDDSGMEYDKLGNLKGAVDRRWAMEDLEAANADLFDNISEEQAEQVRKYNRARLAGETEAAEKLYEELAVSDFGEAFTIYVDAMKRANELKGASHGGTLADYIRHEELFANYPQLKNMGLEFKRLEEGTNGEFDGDTITLNEELWDAPENTLIHEIQHAIQRAEGFAKGSNPEYWRNRIHNAATEYYNAKHEFEYDAEVSKLMNAVYRGELAEEDYDEALGRLMEKNPGVREKYEAYREAEHFMNSVQYGENPSPESMYYNTAGEIEARDAASRRTMTQEQRRQAMPDTGDENTVFAENGRIDAEYIPGTISESETEQGIQEVASMEPVFSVKGTEFMKGETDLVTQVTEFFGKQGVVINPQLGDVILNRRSAKSDIAHGIGRNKAAAFAAVPSVLENGRVIDYQENWKGRGYDTAVVAAPVTIAGDPYIMGVILRRTPSDNTFYLHEVQTKKEALPFKTGTGKTGTPGGNASTLQSLLREVVNVKNAVNQDAVENSDIRFSVEEDAEEAEGLSLPTLEESEQTAEDQGIPGAQRDADGTWHFPDGSTDIDSYTKYLEEKATAAKAERMRNVSREEFVGTPALEKLGVKVANSVGIYQNIDQLKANDKAAKQVRKEMQKAERRLQATEAERNFASGIAAGVYGQEDIPATMDADKVMELADYYWAERAVAGDLIRQQRTEINRALSEKIETIMDQVDDSNVKIPKGFTMNHRTPTRNMIKIFGDEIGGELNAFLFCPVADNEAERYRFVNRMHDEVRAFEDSKGKKKKLTQEERAVVQQVIEGRAAEEMVASMEMSEAIRNAAQNIHNGSDAADAAREFSLNSQERKLAEQYSRWLDAKETLESGKVDDVKVENAVKKYSEMFDLFYDATNDFLVAHGYEPIGFIKGYAPHLQPESNQNLLNKALRAMGVPADVSSLPTSIAGQTANFKPNKRFNPFHQHRTGDSTQYDIATAYETYVDYMSDILYHTDDIMRVRQASNYFRRTYAPEEIRENLSWAEELRYAPTEQKANFLRDNEVLSKTSALSDSDINKKMDEYVDELYENITNTTKYSDFVVWLDDYANNLAAKQLFADRDMERTVGRTSLNAGRKLTRWFARAQVAGNISSALNQTAQLPMILSENGAKYTTMAIKDTIAGRLKKAAWIQESDFLTEKKGIHYIVNTPGEMVTSALFKPLEFTDSFMATLAVRGRYLKEIHAGKNHAEAMKAADTYGRNVMGSRAKGSIPLAFQQKNIISQMLHVFQVESANSWEHLSQDLPRDFRIIAKEKGKAAAVLSLAGVIVKMLLGAFLLNRLAEELYGGTPAPFDILGLTANFIASGEGLSTNEYLRTVIDNGWEKLTGERLFDSNASTLDGDFDWGAAFENAGYTVGNDIPYLRNAMGMLGWGDETLPMLDIPGAVTGIKDAAADEGVFSWEMMRQLLGIAGDVMPGGRQLEKSAQGLETVIRGGDYSGYGENEKLKYPIGDDFWTTVKALMFGKYATGESDSYYASGVSALSANQTQLYQELVEDGADRMEMYTAIQEYREIDNNDELDGLEKGQQERDLISSLDLNDEQKLAFYKGMKPTATSTAEKFQALMDAGMSWDQVMDAYGEYAELKANEDLKATQQATDFAHWVDNQDYTEDQTAAVKEQFVFYSMVPAEASRYEKLTGAGLDETAAYDLTATLTALKPEDGKSSVSEMQQYRSIAAADLSDAEKVAAIGSIMGTDMTTESGGQSQYAKMLSLLDNGVTLDEYLDLKESDAVDGYLKYIQASAGRDYGITPDIYRTAKTSLPAYDADGNGSYKNAEIQAAINGISGDGEQKLLLMLMGEDVPESVSLTNTQKAVLWQLLTGSSSAKNNPYDTTVGQWILDGLKGKELNVKQLPRLDQSGESELAGLSLPKLD